jgi:hypothetical protein
MIRVKVFEISSGKKSGVACSFGFVLSQLSPPARARGLLACNVSLMRAWWQGDGPTEITSQVSRRERRILLKKFRREQRLDRRRFKLKVRAMWDEEIADGK